MKKLTLLILCILLLVPISAHAQNFEERINERNQAIRNIQENQAEAEQAIQDLGEEIDEVTAEFERVAEEKQQAEQELNKINEDILELEESIVERQERLHEQMRNLQMNQGQNSLLHIVTTAPSFSEFLIRSRAFLTLLGASNDILTMQKADMEKLDKLYEEINEKIETIDEISHDLKHKQSSLFQMILSQEVQIAQLAVALSEEVAERDQLIEEMEEAERRKQEILAERARKEELERQAAALAYEQEQARLREEEELRRSQQVINQVQITPESEEAIIESTEQATPAPSSNHWVFPVPNPIVTSPFGPRPDPTGFSGNFHSGIDFGGSSSTPIFAARAGVVIDSAFNGMAGNYIVIDHGDGWFSYYAHNSRNLVATGTQVAAGQTIAMMGTTGNSTGVHLHFAIATSPNWTGFVNPAGLLGL